MKFCVENRKASSKMCCVLCGSTDLTSFERTMKKGNKTYLHCENCDLVFLDRSQILSPEDEKKRYLYHQNSADNSRYLQIFDDFTQKIVTHMGLDGREMLDYGSGPEPVYRDRLIGQYALKRADIFDRYFTGVPPYGEYDLITSIEVFEHFDKVDDELTRICALLRSGGYLAVMTRFHPGEYHQFLNWWYINDTTHISFFSHKTMRVAAEMFHLEIIAEDAIEYTLFRKQ